VPRTGQHTQHDYVDAASVKRRIPRRHGLRIRASICLRRRDTGVPAEVYET